MNRDLLWFPRVILACVMTAHGVAKIVLLPAFEAKFQLGPILTLLAAVAELSAAVGFLIGGALDHGTNDGRRLGAVTTLLAVLAVCCVQVPAIAMVHWYHGWFYFKSGVEYNCVLLALCLMLTVASVRVLRTGKR